MPVLIYVLAKQYDTLKNEKHRERVFLGHAILALSRSPKTRLVDEFVEVIYGQKRLGKLKLRIQDYAKDGHTERGEGLGRNKDTVGGMKFLLDVGAKLKDEDTRPELTKYKEKVRELWLEEARLKEEEEKKNKGTS